MADKTHVEDIDRSLFDQKNKNNYKYKKII